MSTPTEPVPTPAADQDNPTAEALQADLAATRERLAANVEALAAKADVKGQATQKAEETADQLKDGAQDLITKVQQLPPAALAGIALGVGLVLVLAIRGSRRG